MSPGFPSSTGAEWTSSQSPAPPRSTHHASLPGDHSTAHQPFGNAYHSSDTNQPSDNLYQPYNAYQPIDNAYPSSDNVYQPNDNAPPSIPDAFDFNGLLPSDNDISPLSNDNLLQPDPDYNLETSIEDSNIAVTPEDFAELVETDNETNVQNIEGLAERTKRSNGQDWDKNNKVSNIPILLIL